jgi:uncharacterized protein (TIGR02145 family)
MKVLFPAVALVVAFSLGAGQEKKEPVVITGVPDSVLVDARNGKQYKTIKIGDQVWMAENLNIGNLIPNVKSTAARPGAAHNGIIEKYAYGNHESNADTGGGLYQWDEAMGYSPAERAQGICPAGWHIPADAEWATLMDAAGGQAQAGMALQAGSPVGFNAPLTGYRGKNGCFYGLGTDLGFWTSTQYDAATAWGRFLYRHDPKFYRDRGFKTGGYCVRCVRD